MADKAITILIYADDIGVTVRDRRSLGEIIIEINYRSRIEV